MPLTEQDARALTYLAKRLRDETHGANRWDEAGIFAVVAKLTGRNLAVAIEQVTRHAADPEAKTPGAINRPFLPERAPSEARFPPKRDQECRRHPGEWTDACRPCATEGRENEPEPTEETPMPPNVTSPAAAARALIRQAKAALCNHGVPLRNCAKCETETREDV